MDKSRNDTVQMKAIEQYLSVAVLTSICSDEGLTLDTSAFQSLYGAQFTLSTPLINQIFVFHSPHRRSTIVSLETNPLYLSVVLFAIVNKLVLPFTSVDETQVTAFK